MKLIDHINAYLKAHLAGLVTATTLLVNDLHQSNGKLNYDQGYAIAGAYLVAAGIVAVAPNVAKPVVDDVVDTVDGLVPDFDAPPVDDGGND